ncbi:hypothetical protein PFAG_02295 [Plasmodium falciparum Santa Lucia]|uniref:Uncharacterized protein n=10 Tax=Plasmodium falciparum TaxID=5833 RepID=W7K5I2_PLAFO|nr:hypothetical protein PFFVO_02349 [Plasmodium falciparum Vietnam Oak-Knoll (FVO)]ETW30956.1 hypothetical protein PFFCH_01623 [Plasmodium falciparum FCH/4]ETW36834.1 hypothetical protein PFTANZ_02417 [Plasmodium falciparum Tanzania (2000708)]ETW42993.1 hypothetical protein PFNF135_02468 [Plasmodium falciparum NF135/5.C10]ETW56934.1 hypothetical protein PFUGPA_01135 [Plasmodium falciparum Palo Alto/Uganda]ETW61841.1 hypothetical protein PFMC_02310 [Plasmodium falciparum CAMP/Malaysia]EUR72296
MVLYVAFLVYKFITLNCFPLPNCNMNKHIFYCFYIIIKIYTFYYINKVNIKKFYNTVKC